MLDAVAVVRAYLDAVTRFELDAVAGLLHPQMKFHELPNRIRPAGGVDDREAMLAGLRKASAGKVLSAQRYHISEVIGAGDRVVVTSRWEGDLVIPVGRLKAGEMMVAHICMVFRVEDGLLIEQRNYDCYEEFGA